MPTEAVPWLRPAMAFSAMASAILAGTFLLVWLQFVRRRHALVWSLAWLAGTIHVGIAWWLLRPGVAQASGWLSIVDQLLVVVNAALMAAGGYEFVHRRLPLRWFLLAALPVLLWFTLVPAISQSLAESSWPTALAVGGSYLWTATRFAHLRTSRGTRGATLVAVLFAIAGLHELDYPLLSGVAWFAPFGYSLQALLASAISIGLLILILEEARGEAERERAALRSILDQLPVGVVVASQNGEVTLANPEARRLLGDDVLLGGGTLLPHEARLFRRADGTPLSPGEGPLARTLRTGQAVTAAEWTVDGPARRRQPLLVNAGPVRDERSGVAGAVLALQDIGGFKALQSELAQAGRHQGLGTLAAGVAHDFNNALTMILGHAELAGSGQSDPDVKQSIETIERVASDAAAIVRRLQNVARTRGSQDMAACDLAAIARETVDIARPRWRDEAQADGRTYTVTTELPEPLPVRGDAAELREVILNLVLNALDAMPQGGSLTIGGGRDGADVTLSVTDTGHGMRPEVRDRIFDPYYTTKGARGTGLGLAVVFGIVRRHQGRIEVESEPGSGTRFLLRLPCELPVEAAAVSDVVPEVAPLRVLVVDDEVLVRGLLASLLSLEGHEPVLAESGAEALRLLGRDSFDVVLTDLGMPDMNGWELTARILAQVPAARVALVTGWGDSLRPEQVEESGVVAVLTKPFTRARLAECLRRAVA